MYSQTVFLEIVNVNVEQCRRVYSYHHGHTEEELEHETVAVLE